MNYMMKLFRRKKRQFLILSASDIHIGLKCLYLELMNNTWHIHFNQSIHYPNTIIACINEIYERSHKADDFDCIQKIAELDNRLSRFYLEIARTILTHIPEAKRHTDLIILNRFSLWRGAVEDKEKQYSWSLSSGDPAILSSSFDVPVITDFAHQNMILTNTSEMPLLYGDFLIAQKAGTIAGFLDIGSLSRLTVIDTVQQKLIIDSVTGPASSLIDSAAKSAGAECGFDRDGTVALSGTPDTKALEILFSDQNLNAMRNENSSDYLNAVLSHQALNEIQPNNKVATITAFVAFTIADFYKTKINSDQKPDKLWLCGGGTYNMALIEYCKAYLSPLPVISVEQLGVPDNYKSLLSLGLTVNSHLNNQQVFFPQSGAVPHFGKWIFS